MKRPELAFNITAVFVDLLMLCGAAFLSFYSRSRVTDYVGPVLFELDVSRFTQMLYYILPLQSAIFAFLGLYNLRSTSKFPGEFARIILGISVGLFLIIILFFFNQTVFPSRYVILAAWGFAIVFVAFGRSVLKLLQRQFLRKGLGLHKVAVINGAHEQSEIITQAIKDPGQGYVITSELAYTSDTVSELQKLYDAGRLDEIMQANPTLTDQQNLALVEFARNKGLEFSFVPNLFDVQRNIVEVTSILGVPVISLKNTPLDGWGKVAKRVFDIVVSSFCLLITAPIFLAIYLAVKLDSPGPAIYAYLRGGRGRDFMFYKFRSMYTHLSSGLGGREAEKAREELWKKNDRGGAEGPFLKIKNDPRITRVGRFIRKTKLDEVPQFWNVLKGDMSMVGPRAHMIDEVVRYRDRYRRLFSVKPGIFGVSQIAQMSWPDLPFEEENKLNTYYIENWSLWFDIKILAKSFWLLFFAPKSKDDY